MPWDSRLFFGSLHLTESGLLDGLVERLSIDGLTQKLQYSMHRQPGVVAHKLITNRKRLDAVEALRPSVVIADECRNSKMLILNEGADASLETMFVARFVKIGGDTDVAGVADENDGALVREQTRFELAMAHRDQRYRNAVFTPDEGRKAAFVVAVEIRMDAKCTPKIGFEAEPIDLGEIARQQETQPGPSAFWIGNQKGINRRRCPLEQHSVSQSPDAAISLFEKFGRHRIATPDFGCWLSFRLGPRRLSFPKARQFCRAQTFRLPTVRLLPAARAALGRP